MSERKRKVPPISESNRNASRMSESKRKRIDINWLDRHPDILKNYVHDQGETQVCWAFAVAFCVSMLAVIQFGVPGNGNWILSVQELVDRVCQVYDREKIQGYQKDVLNMGKEFVFKQNKDGTYGALTAYAFIYCKEFGLSYGYKYPFVWRRNMGKSMPSEDEVPRIYISNYKILKGYAPEHMVEILDSLEKQPLVGKLYSTPEFRETLYHYRGRASGIENITRIGDKEIKTGAHSVVILGYSGRLNAFLILNSWGRIFGSGGLLLVSSELLFDVGWPELASQENTVCKFECTPRKRQFCEHIVVGSSNILASTKQDANAKPMEVTKNGSVKQSIAKSKVEGSSSDDEESVNKAPVVALAAKLMDVSSDESDSEDSSDSDDDELIVKASVKQVPVGAVSKKGTATTKKKVESSDDSDSDDSSSSDDDSPAPNAALSKRPSSTTASKKKLSTKEVDNKEDSSSESEEEEPKKKKLKVQESSSEEDDSEEESSDDDASKEEEEEKKILKTPKKKDADVVMGDAESVKTETKKAPQTPRGPQVVATGTKTLFVGNLSFSIQRADMEAFFKDLGEVVDVRFALGGDENFKGFGHVEFATFEAAQAESVNKAPVVALAAKLMDVFSDESDSEDSSDSDDDELIVKASVKQVPVGAVSKKGTATTKKKVESSDDSDSDDSSSSDDDSPAPNAALSKRPSSTTASKKKLSTKEVDNKEDSSSESEEEEPKKKKLKVQPTVLESIEKESSSEEDDSEEESSDDDASKEEEEEKKILKTPKKKDADVVMGDAESVKTETKKAPQTPRGPQVPIWRLFFKTLGFGHVAFATFEAAQAAMELNGRNLSGRPVRFNFAWDRSAYTPSSSKGNSFQKGGRTRVHTIFVRGFDTSGDENNIRSALKKHFETCGDISRISVPKDYESGAVKGFASMDFMDNDGFNQALELDGSEFGESYLNVEEAKPRGDGGGDSRDGRTSGRFGNSSNGDRFGSDDGGDRSRGGRGGRSDQGRTRGRGRGGPTRPSMATVGTGKKTVFDD
ncbi:hypothetical protein POM88_054487 [Heracleum sosnowskyi]|uniref:RRM domain-containing protein n=1 Tax=Heracleum sosnowskyi TaxID=360622 RepID=A0AAD8LUS5_9APIA|nr:hypothetical protein POM88_054487 [Heracleum sosnowskyi]